MEDEKLRKAAEDFSYDISLVVNGFIQNTDLKGCNIAAILSGCLLKTIAAVEAGHISNYNLSAEDLDRHINIVCESLKKEFFDYMKGAKKTRREVILSTLAEIFSRRFSNEGGRNDH
jgi:hypothetical protein